MLNTLKNQTSLTAMMAGLVLLGSQAHANSATPVPFYVGDMSPLTYSYGAPRSAMPAYLNAGQWQSHVSLDIANSTHIENVCQEDLLLDAETTYLMLALEYGLSYDWDMRFELPFVNHGKGFLDSSIDNYHQRFGFPEGNRPAVGKDEINIRYKNAGKELININNSVSGVGDVGFSFVRSVKSSYEDTLSYGIKFKLPTGDEKELTGSGTLDVAVWASGSNVINSRAQQYMSLGLVRTGKDKGLLASVRNSGYGFLNYGLAYQASPSVTLKAQVDAHSDIYETDTKLLGHSVTLSVGGTVALSPTTDLDLALTEDIAVESAPDVSFHMNVRKRFAF